MANVPGIMTVAEESTAFPGRVAAGELGGLGFGFKWNMGWMNDTLSYMQKDPIYRKLSPPPDDLWPGLCLVGKLHPADQP
jgi:1,4-alpha-glucan branching enzyme